jgi:hypothetical protein
MNDNYKSAYQIKVRCLQAKGLNRKVKKNGIFTEDLSRNESLKKG